MACARGIARARFATTFVQVLVAVIARMVWPAGFNRSVVPAFVPNLLFAALFAGSALLFRHAARQTDGCGVRANA